MREDGISPEEMEVIAALAACSFRPACWEKRFVRNMAAQARNADHKALSERQHTMLYALRWRYRRQISGRVPGLDYGRECAELIKLPCWSNDTARARAMAETAARRRQARGEQLELFGAGA
ncbi:MAG: hypothetical protein ACLFWF_08000 [Alphaproteobacteria bacterium]